MNDRFLSTYLNDHLAGSVAAMELIRKAIEKNLGNEFALLLRKFLAEIAEEQGILKTLISRLEASPSKLKRLSAWLAEKLSRLKINSAFAGYSAESRFLDFEALFLGVNGKLDLWRALKECLSWDSRFSDVDFDSLWKRSLRQRDQIQDYCMKAARLAFHAPPEGPMGKLALLR